MADKVSVAACNGDPWQCSLTITSRKDGALIGTVRPVQEGDEELLVQFGREGLSAESRQMFECYKWTSDELLGELRTAIQTSVSRKDLHLIALDEHSVVVGYIFLWAASDEIPELGIAVADRWHGKGLGPELLKCMEQMGKIMNKQAFELTTMLPNKVALAVYKRAGWDHLGVIHNPLGCDVPAAFEGKATPSGIAAENHCALIIDEGRRHETLAHLAKKRERAKLIFPVPEGGFDDTGVYRYA